METWESILPIQYKVQYRSNPNVWFKFLSLFFSMWPAKDLQISHDNCVSDHVSSAKNFCLYIDKTHLKDDYYISSCNFYLITTLPSFNALQFLLKLILSSYYFFRKALFYL